MCLCLERGVYLCKRNVCVCVGMCVWAYGCVNKFVCAREMCVCLCKRVCICV